MENGNFSEELLKELAFSPEELAELEEAKKMPIVFDEDCSEITPERAVLFQRVNPPRQVRRMPAV